jgi:hypothetical protein
LREEVIFTYVEGMTGLQKNAASEVKIGGLPDEERPAIYMWRIIDREISFVKLGKDKQNYPEGFITTTVL